MGGAYKNEEKNKPVITNVADICGTEPIKKPHQS